jgi:iron complex outermembrane receptor protein
MRRVILLLTLVTWSWLSAGAQQSGSASQDLSAMSIEALMNVQVTSVSRKSEPLSRAAAAITVITQEDIRRSGATSIPDLLRMVPGLDVAQMDSSTWAISARGFNTQYATYMLVLVDGRTVYDPTFNGVRWDAQDTILEDIDHIEVICGPGTALWGQNAVNGVISITTKKASQTQGGLVTVAAGNLQTPETAVRYGGEAGSKGHYRIFGKYFDRQEQDLASGAPASDGWASRRIGFRGDWDLTKRDSLTILGGGYEDVEHHLENVIISLVPPVQEVITVPTHSNGADFLVKWQRTFSDRSDMALQAYHNHTDTRDITYGERRNTSDIDFQHHVAIKSRHDLVWGLGLRYTVDDTSGSFQTSFSPRVDHNATFSLFAQHEIVLLPNRVRLVWGARFTQDNYVGAEIQPDARLLWTPSLNHSFWLAISNPTSEPSFFSKSVRFSQMVFTGPGGVPGVAVVLGSPDFRGKNALALQAGYRGKLGQRLSVSAAGFYSRYDGLLSTSPGAPFLETDPAPPHLVVPIFLQSATPGETHGLETTGTWQVSSRWRLAASYGLFLIGLRGNLPATSTGTSPQNQFQIHSYLNLPRNWEWDAFVYETGKLATDNIPAYTRVDTRVGWRFAESASLSLVGQNLLQPRHFEFGTSSGNINTTQVRRSGYAKLTWTF